MQIRLNKFIAQSSHFSRRKADELIQAGRVFINNQKADLGATVNPETDLIRIDNKDITLPKTHIYLALNKPAGYICTRKDELGRQNIIDLVPPNQNLKPVGRLDKDTEGLILISNDGEFINQYTHPKFQCDKEYFVKAEGEITSDKKSQLENGVIIDGKKTAPAKIEILSTSPKRSSLTITIHEGRNRQIRKMFAKIKCPVKYLKRIRIGKIKLNSLKSGQYRNLTTSELNAYQFT